MTGQARTTSPRQQGIVKAGDWASYKFHRYTNSHVKDPNSMALLQVPIRHRDTFYKYLRNK